MCFWSSSFQNVAWLNEISLRLIAGMSFSIYIPFMVALAKNDHPVDTNLDVTSRKESILR